LSIKEIPFVIFHSIKGNVWVRSASIFYCAYCPVSLVIYCIVLSRTFAHVCTYGGIYI